MNSLFSLIMLLPLVLLAALLIALASTGRISLTTGRLTNSRFSHWLGVIYPAVLLSALALYYWLPFEHLYHAEVAAYQRSSSSNSASSGLVTFAESTDPQTELLHDLLMADDMAALDASGLPLTKETLSFTSNHLDIAHPFTRVMVSSQPSADGTIVLRYYSGRLTVDYYDLSELLALMTPEFVIDQNTLTTLDMLNRSEFERQALKITCWSNPFFLKQFSTHAEAPFISYTSRDPETLIVQIPADVTVTYFSDPIPIGEWF